MAKLRYYSQQGGVFTRDVEGLMAGIEWQDAALNSFRAIIYIPDLSLLQNGKEITFIYRLEVLPVDQDKFLLRDTKTITISNNVKVDFGALVDLSKLFGRQLAAPTSSTPIGQLDLFIGLYFTGLIAYPTPPLPPIYTWLSQIVADLEGQVIEEPVDYVFLAETLAIVALLETLGIFLNMTQKISLDMTLRGNPAPAATKGKAAQAKAQEYYLPIAQEWLVANGYQGVDLNKAQ